MKASFSFNRFGVNRRMINERSRVWSGGSMVTMCSLIGSWSRLASMIAPTSSPSSGTGKLAKGPITELHEEKSSVLR